MTGIRRLRRKSPDGQRLMTDTRPSVLLYDWDNTLVDGWAGITAALNAVFAAFGHTLWTVEDTRNRVRVSLRESFPGHVRRPVGARPRHVLRRP